MASFRVSDRADEELINIYVQGRELFGVRQAAAYQFELDECFTLLAANPRMGRPARRVAPGVRRHEHGSHVILYRESEQGVLILAVVHARSLHGLEL